MWVSSRRCKYLHCDSRPRHHQPQPQPQRQQQHQSSILNDLPIHSFSHTSCAADGDNDNHVGAAADGGGGGGAEDDGSGGRRLRWLHQIVYSKPNNSNNKVTNTLLLVTTINITANANTQIHIHKNNLTNPHLPFAIATAHSLLFDHHYHHHHLLSLEEQSLLCYQGTMRVKSEGV